MDVEGSGVLGTLRSQWSPLEDWAHAQSYSGPSSQLPSSHHQEWKGSPASVEGRTSQTGGDAVDRRHRGAPVLCHLPCALCRCRFCSPAFPAAAGAHTTDISPGWAQLCFALSAS